MNPKIHEYLVHCYLYYKLDSCIISDSEFDALCKELYDSGVEHPLISREDLSAGTGYSITNYPEEVIDDAEERLKKHTPESAPVVEEKRKPMKFNGHPMETYLLLGMYIDFGYARDRERQDEVRAELQKRWSAGMHKETFAEYFKYWDLGPERFKLA